MRNFKPQHSQEKNSPFTNYRKRTSRNGDNRRRNRTQKHTNHKCETCQRPYQTLKQFVEDAKPPLFNDKINPPLNQPTINSQPETAILISAINSLTDRLRKLSTETEESIRLLTVSNTNVAEELKLVKSALLTCATELKNV